MTHRRLAERLISFALARPSPLSRSSLSIRLRLPPQHLQQVQLPLLLLLLAVSAALGAVASDTSAPPPPPTPLRPSPPRPLALPTLPPPAQRLLGAFRSGVCPCAYLERGGFWGGDIASSLGVANGVYVESRCRCSYAFNCARRWQSDEAGSSSSKSITVTWIGSYGVSSSQIQLQFCSAIYHAAVATCSPAEVTFSLRQIGWWVDLQGVFCRCPAGSRPAIDSFIYARPLAISDSFNGRLVDFVCDSKPLCQAGDWCYEELLDSDQKLTQGKVTCSCPAGAFCPIYHIGPASRVPMFNDTTEPATLIGYRLRCRLESTTT